LKGSIKCTDRAQQTFTVNKEEILNFLKLKKSIWVGRELRGSNNGSDVTNI
jgi:hypothetical protein